MHLPADFYSLVNLNRKTKTTTLKKRIETSRTISRVKTDESSKLEFEKHI